MVNRLFMSRVRWNCERVMGGLNQSWEWMLSMMDKNKMSCCRLWMMWLQRRVIPLQIDTQHACSSSIFMSTETGEGELRRAGWWIGELDVMMFDVQYHARSARHAHAHAQETQRRSARRRSTPTVYSTHAAGYEDITFMLLSFTSFTININMNIIHFPHHCLSIRSHLHPCSINSFTNSS